MREILAGIAELLKRYGQSGPSSFVSATAHTADPEALWSAVSGLEFWGGPGAVWEIEPFGLSHPGGVAAQRDYRLFQHLMIDLADLLDSKGLSALAARNAALFRRELAAEE